MFTAGVLTVSDKGSRGERVDESGKVIKEALVSLGAGEIKYGIVPDERSAISSKLREWSDAGVDLVLTDLIMPGLDGTKLIDEIKGLSPQTPAILLSGKVRIYDRDTRADVFLAKGMYAPADLLERIRLLLVRKRGPKRAPSPRVPSQPSAA